MNSRDFVYWLQGFFEIGDEGEPRDVAGLTPKQVAAIRRHLALVFKHEIDPSAGPPAHQAELDAIHAAPAAPAAAQGGNANAVGPWSGGGGKGPVYRC